MLFDSLIHPPLGTDKHFFHSLSEELEVLGFFGGVVVQNSRPGQDSMDSLFEGCRAYGNLHPVPGVDPLEENAQDFISLCKDKGAVAIKLHPRISKFSLDEERELCRAVERCAKEGLVIYFCTYFFSDSEGLTPFNSTTKLFEIISRYPSVRFVLLHGGGPLLLTFTEFCRANTNTLLDLSFTFLKYAGSSLDADINFLFHNFDQRICVGSDYPDFELNDFQTKFTSVTTKLSKQKRDNIAFKNLKNFLSI